jgi:Holliday junction resolvase RusA-like endonuclease
MKLPLKPFSINKAWRGGRRFKTDDYKAWQQQGVLALRGFTRYHGEVEVRIRGTTSRYGQADVDNWIKPILDLLVLAEIIVDDSRVVRVSCEKSRCRGGDETIEIEIINVEENERLAEDEETVGEAEPAQPRR